MNVNLVCPKCLQQALHALNEFEQYHRVVCPQCQTVFNTWIAKIRAKHSRQNKKSNIRDYTVRVIEFSGRENLLEFRQPGISDFELRSGDLAAFNYLNNVLLVVQNLTVSRYVSLKASGCLGIVVLGVVGLLVFSLTTSFLLVAR